MGKTSRQMMARFLLALVMLGLSHVSFAALQHGVYGGQHWEMTVNADLATGSIEGDCSSGNLTITPGTYAVGTGTPINMSVSLTLQFTSTGSSKSISVSDGLLATDNETLTGTFVTGTY